METIKMTQNEQGFTSGEVERAVSIQKQLAQNLIQVTQEYKIDLLAVQEVKWIGRNTIEKKDCRIYYSCDDKQYIFRTGFTLSKCWRSREIDFKPTDSRTYVLRIRGKFKN